jgi:opacity protein-like surface antigen
LFAVVAMSLSLVATQNADAQGFVSPSYGYNFGGDAGCPSVTDCRGKNWNFSLSFGTLGSIVGFEGEWTHDNKFFGDAGDESSSVTTWMGNFLLAPRIGFLQPYGLAGLGVIRTSVDERGGEPSKTENQFGWTVGGGLLVYITRHIGVKGDVRYYYSFNSFELSGLELGRDDRKLDFGRGAFGVVLMF